MPEPACHYCDKSAEGECPTCGRLYCSDHGGEVCLRCSAPASVAPTALAYRGSLVALGIASVVAIFLIISPPQDEAIIDDPRPVSTSTPAVEATATATPNEGSEQRPTTTIATPTPNTDTGTEPGDMNTDADADTDDSPEGITYTVQPGDTLSTVAADHDVSVDDILAANDDIADAESIIQPGQDIIIPASE